MFVEKRALETALLIIFTAFIGVVFNSSIVCRICVLFLLIICILKGLREKYILNPYYMFALVPFTLLIYANISNYHVNLTVTTWLIAIINIAIFIVSMDFTPTYNRVDKCKGLGDYPQIKYHTLLLLILGFMPKIYAIIFGGMMPLASIFTLFSTGAVVCAMKSKKKSLILFVFVIFLVSWIKYVNKTTVLSFAIAVLIGYEKYYAKTYKQKRNLFILSVFGLLLMIAAFSFANQGRGSESGMSALQYYTRYGGAIWDKNQHLFMPYMYLTTPWANLQYVMETQANHTYGLWFLKPLIGYLQLDYLFEDFYQLKAYSNFNTFTYLACCYKDFGFWGSCLSSAFLGFFTKKVYSRFIVSASPLDITCYILVAQAVIEMFFSNHFFTQSYPFTIILIMGLYKIVLCKNNKIELDD